MNWIEVNESLPVMMEPMCGNKSSVPLLFTDSKCGYYGYSETVKSNGRVVWSTDDDEIVENVTHCMYYPKLPDK